MKEYPNQPESMKTKDMAGIQLIIKKVLEEDLPDCRANQWFIESVHFANMLDKIMEEIWVNV